MCLLCTIGSSVWQTLIGYTFQMYLPWEAYIPGSTQSQSQSSSDRDKNVGAAVIAALHFLSYLIILNTLVPISLYIRYRTHAHIFIHSFIHSFIPLFIRLFTRSFIHFSLNNLFNNVIMTICSYIPHCVLHSIELIRLTQSWFINWDEQMCDVTTSTHANSRTTTLNEELGQIRYIFTDKTGTLTQVTI